MGSEGDYLRRVVDDHFVTRMRSAGAILIEGPKWCGKTRTAEQMAASALYCQDPDEREAIIHQARTRPSALLDGDKPRLIDEWQIIPVIWDSIRYSIDRSGKRGQYILTGSSVPKLTDDEASKMHSGVGRIVGVRMRPMSLFESKDSSGTVSIRDLFDGTEPQGRSDTTLEELAYLVCRGGWPSSVGMEKDIALQVAQDYCEAIARDDCIRVDGVKRDYFVMKGIMRSLGRLVCSRANLDAIVADLRGNETVSSKTVSDYIDVLRRLFVAEDIPAWVPSMVSRSRIRRTSKRCYADPSIAAATVGAGPRAMMADMPMFGVMFECLCIRDLRVYSQPLGGNVFHYHDETGLEVDAIVELNDGRWAAFEVKLSNVPEDQAARSLNRLRKKVQRPPEFMAILTGAGFAHRREDGILVIPIGCLRD